MRETLAFVPVGENAHVAAIATVPDDDPRAVVVLTTGGGGVPRSHKYRLWTKLARRLAEHGVASVRIEWPGVGDSTGTLRLSLSSPPVDQLTEVARFAMAAMGTTRLGLVGNCLGARSSVHVATSRLRCEAVALLLLKPVTYRRRSEASRRLGKRIRARVPRRIKDLGRPLLRRLTGADRRGRTVVQALARLRETTDVLLLEPPIQQTREMAELAAARRDDSGRRFELRDLPGLAMQDFDTPEQQDALIGTLVDWFVGSFAEAEPAGPPLPASVRGAGETLRPAP